MHPTNSLSSRQANSWITLRLPADESESVNESPAANEDVTQAGLRKHDATKQVCGYLGKSVPCFPYHVTALTQARTDFRYTEESHCTGRYNVGCYLI